MVACDYIDDLYRDEDEDRLDTLIPSPPQAFYSQEPGFTTFSWFDPFYGVKRQTVL